MRAGHAHAEVPEDPSDGDRFVCACGYASEYVVLDGSGEWVTIDSGS